MKIQCDICIREEASVFCSADQAALCSACDTQIHHANKLAGKHHRFSLHSSSSKDAPRCDVCQERRAFLFCQEDRAILCRDCDLPIHTANQHTSKHNRFLLTGVKLSPSTTSSSNDVRDADGPVRMNNPQLPIKNKPTSASSQVDPPPLTEHTASQGGPTSSISEYLIEMLPGWQVDDFLDSVSSSWCL